MERSRTRPGLVFVSTKSSRLLLLLSLLVLLPFVASQLVQTTPFMASPTTAVASSLPSTLITSKLGSSGTTFALVSTSNSSSSTSIPSRPVSSDATPFTDGDPGSSGGTDTDHDRQSSLLNYYFVFLALFLAILFIGIYAVHRRRKVRKARTRSHRQDALARDVDGWVPPNGGATGPGSRRWVHGLDRFGRRALESRDGVNEGLDEFGEAPPPYKPDRGLLPASDAPGAPSVPLRTLSRDAAGKPPGYDETIRQSVASSADEQLEPQLSRSSPTPRLSRPATPTTSETRR